MQTLLVLKRAFPIRFFTLLLVLILSGSAFAQTPEWYVGLSRIKVFESTMSDVERAFSSPKVVEERTGGAGLTFDYAIKEGRLSVTYSLGECTEKNTVDYNLPKGTVTEIEVYLRKPAKLSRFGLDLTKFEMVEISDVVGLFDYFSEDGSIEISGSRTKLHRIRYRPSDEQEALSCKNFLETLHESPGIPLS